MTNQKPKEKPEIPGEFFEKGPRGGSVDNLRQVTIKSGDDQLIQYPRTNIFSESDVEQKIIYPLLTNAMPLGLGYQDAEILTKPNIRKILIEKGQSKHYYFPDYVVIIDGFPMVLIEAKAPKADLMEALREARLYASEINSSYKQSVNPCSKIFVTDGDVIFCGFWDQNNPYITLRVDDITIVNEKYNIFQNFLSKTSIQKEACSIKQKIRKDTKYMKPVFMLGGKTTINASIGDNSFGANMSLDYRYLFNPESYEDRSAIAKNAYIASKQKLSHVKSIDKIIRSTLPQNVINSKIIKNSAKPVEIYEQLSNVEKVKNEICLLIGSVGSGKSTFTDYLKEVALPDSLKKKTEWIMINLNKAPINREMIYDWIVKECIKELKEINSKIDFDCLDTLNKIYASKLNLVKIGRAALYPADSQKEV